MLSDQTRYRVTGTILLVALAAIFFPMLFDGDGLDPLELPPLDEQHIDVSAVEAVQDEPVPDFASTIAGRDEVLAETDAEGYRLETGVKIGEPVLAEEDEPLEMPADAWAVQVGSFAEHERAEALGDRLRSDGYHVLTSKLKVAGQRPEKRTRVAVGPMIDREDADRLKSELSDRYGVDAIVVRFGY
ncbi:MAG: SPOR domain-containing protein [Gammaproteobacteria bacterium]|nr:SPOR domain-containing protein [Gammaproteobacteria bacterium]